MAPHSLSTSELHAAVTALKEGRLVALPTETVYGLAADACNSQAVARIYAMKGRPSHNPLITHVSDAAMAQIYAQWHPLADALAHHFWPGPLTLVLKRRTGCPLASAVSAGSDTVALRCPAHPATQAVIAAFGGGLAAPSANRSGRISPTLPAHVQQEFADTELLILDGGASVLGIESTVVDASDGEAVAILRPGSVTEAMLLQAGIKLRSAAPVAAAAPLLSPGRLESHYAPRIPVRLDARQVAPDEALLSFGIATVLGTPARTLNLSPGCNLEEAAARLFAYLRELDQPQHRAIAVVSIPQEGVGIAINDRLRRAAAPR